MKGFGCNVLAYDITKDISFAKQHGVQYLELSDICRRSDILMLAVPLNSQTHHMINADLIHLMKREIIIINVARGGIVKTSDILEALNCNRIAAYGSDVYEHEEGVFFYDRSKNKPEDTILQELINAPNVLLTPHQAFATTEALTNIANTTFDTITSWKKEGFAKNELVLELIK